VGWSESDWGDGVMANQPTSFRYPFDHAIEGAEGTHPAVKDAIRYTFSGLKDLNDAVKRLNTKVATNASVIQDITNISSGGGVSPAPTPTPAFGNVNLQPNLTPGAYTLAQSDLGGLILVQSGIAFALTLNSGLLTPFFTTVYNLGVGTITATPSLGSVNNVASVTLLTNEFGIFYFDGTDWWDVFPTIPTGVTFHDPEVPTGTINGTTGSDGNPTFTIAGVPSPPAQFGLTKNGIVMYQGTAYTLSTSTITYLAPYIPVTGDVHETLAYRTA